jgi:tetratricopeptide (TPR) repeat protein
MRPRAFVVMPFGRKPVEASSDSGVIVDFDAVYERLIAPAARAAGLDPFRADEESAAGDIRTDMFFELVTADVVLADLSIGNANVFYELGVRHAITPHGTLSIHGGWQRRPFDVAPDRTFAYDGSGFVVGSAPIDPAPEVNRLANILRLAVEGDARTIASPVYKELPGLRPADWAEVVSARAKYFRAILDDWKRRVRVARREGRPGDILTLADEAPTRYHASTLMIEAARALVDLRRFRVACELLEEIHTREQNNVAAQCYYGLALSRAGRTETALEHMKWISRSWPAHAEAHSVLGRIYKEMWRQRWENIADLSERQLAAAEHSVLADQSLAAYETAHRQKLDSYYTGINALALIAMLEHLEASTGEKVTRPTIPGREELATLVRVTASVALDKLARVGTEVGDVERTWANATLAEEAVLRGDAREAQRHYKRAANAANTTWFQIESMRGQVALYYHLGMRPEVSGAALEFLQRRASELENPTRRYNRVVLFSGHMIDLPSRPEPRFPESAAAGVGERIAAQLSEWRIGPGDLAICSAARGGDLLFTRAALDRGAEVRWFLPADRGEFLQRSVRGASPQWETLYHQLAERVSQVQEQNERIGEPPPGINPFDRNNRWMINTARLEQARDGVLALLVWDGRDTGDGPGGTSDFHERIAGINANLTIIHPLEAATEAAS